MPTAESGARRARKPSTATFSIATSPVKASVRARASPPGSPSAVLEHHERSEPDPAADPDDEDPAAAVEQRLAHRSRRPLHRAGLERLERERERGDAVGHQVDPQDLHRQQDQRPAEQHVGHDRGGLAEVRATAGSARTSGCCRPGGGPPPPRARSRRSCRRCSTMSAAPRATSVPRTPMATPMSARWSAGASFTPSPVIATTSPRACSTSTIRSLCSGVDAREHATRVSDGRRARRRASASSSAPVSTRRRRRQPDLRGDRAARSARDRP